VTPGSISSHASKTFFSGALKTGNIIALVVGGVVLVGTIIAIAVLVSNHANQVTAQTEKPIKKVNEEKGVMSTSQPLPYWMWIIVGGVGIVACVFIGVPLYLSFKKPDCTGCQKSDLES
jgi:hypothetical protein